MRKITIIGLLLTAIIICTACQDANNVTSSDKTSEKSTDDIGGRTEFEEKMLAGKYDWDCGYISIKGKKLEFPFPVSELVTLGFDGQNISEEGYDISNTEVSPEKRWTTPQTFYPKGKEDEKIEVLIYNPNDTTIFLKDALVCGIAVYADSSIASEVIFWDKVSTSLSLEENIEIIGGKKSREFLGMHSYEIPNMQSNISLPFSQLCLTEVDGKLDKIYYHTGYRNLPLY